MLRRAVQGVDDGEVFKRVSGSPELCLHKPGSRRFVICYETEGPQICRLDIREDVGGQGPMVEVTWLLPYGHSIREMGRLMAFSFDELVKAWPESADLRPFATLKADVAQSWVTALRDFGQVEVTDQGNGYVRVAWAAGGKVSRLVGKQDRF